MIFNLAVWASGSLCRSRKYPVSIPASNTRGEPKGWKVMLCWIKYLKKLKNSFLSLVLWSPVKNYTVMTAVLAVQWSTRYSTKLFTRFLKYRTYRAFRPFLLCSTKLSTLFLQYCTAHRFLTLPPPPQYSTYSSFQLTFINTLRRFTPFFGTTLRFQSISLNTHLAFNLQSY